MAMPLPKAEPTEAMISVGVVTLRRIIRDGTLSRDTPVSHIQNLVREIYRAMVGES
jgi:hypothetical protein